MEGGINAWNGLTAEGAPKSGMAYFSSAAKPEELMALAWYLEEGACKFYQEMVQILEDREAGDLFRRLATEEESHKVSLLQLYRKFSGAMSDQGFPGTVISLGRDGDVMEGGMNVSDALKWAKGKKLIDLLELSLSSETHAYDLYLKMGRQIKDQRSAQVFHMLSRDEKEHLERLSLFLEKRI